MSKVYHTYVLQIKGWGTFLVTLFLVLGTWLTFFPAVWAPFWIFAVLVTEGGQWFACLSLANWFCASRHTRLGRATRSLSLVAAVLYLRPSFLAFQLDRPAFSVKTLLFGLRVPPIDVVEKTYWTQNIDEVRHLDLYKPQVLKPHAPIVVVIHGGSWNGGNKGEITGFNRALAAQGYAVASVNYRLAPEWPYPGAQQDIFHALDYLKAHADDLGIDASSFVLVGRSAGGQIALSASYAQQEPTIRGVVSLYGPTDLFLGYEKPSRRGVLDSQKALKDYLGGSPTEKRLAYEAASPIFHVTKASPPTLLIHGSLDPIVWPFHSQRLAKRLADLGRPVTLLELPWGTHGADAIVCGPSGQLVLHAIEQFLDATRLPSTQQNLTQS